MTAGSIDAEAIAALRSRFRGSLIKPDDAEYEATRKIWNGSIDRRPGLIARPTGVDDVVEAAKVAKDAGIQVAVRGGGHSFPGLSTCDRGMVIDLGLMKGVRVDPQTRIASAQAGALLGELDKEAQEYGLAVPAGIVSHTGLAGLTLGGGIGWLMRKYGLTIDQLLSVDLVTADGALVRANETENADLFWAVRGGGGNFGVVTEFEFRLNPVGPAVLGGPIFWPIEQAPALLRFYREWISEAPDELMTILVYRRAPALPIVPPELHGQPVVVVACCYAGPLEEGERVLRPLREFGSPLVDLCEQKLFIDHQKMFDASFLHGRWYYLRSGDLQELSDEVVDICLDRSTRIESPLSTLSVWQMGGAVARASDDSSAFNGRKAGHTVNITGITETAEGFDAEREWVRNTWTALDPYFSSVYVNHLMDEGEDRLRKAYGAEKYDRLKALKRRYDPDNFFRLNQNITP